MGKVKGVVAVMAAGLLVACGSTGDGQQTATPATPAAPAEGVTQTPTTGPGSPATAASDRNAAALAAIATAVQAAGGTAYELDDEDDDTTWEVDVWTGGKGVEVSVSADGSSVLSQRDDDDDDNEDDGPRSAQAKVSLAQAIETALGEVAGTVDDAELEHENGTLVWEVTIDTPDNDDVEVYVSTGDGSVVRVDR